MGFWGNASKNKWASNKHPTDDPHLTKAFVHKTNWQNAVMKFTTVIGTPPGLNVMVICSLLK